MGDFTKRARCGGQAPLFFEIAIRQALSAAPPVLLLVAPLHQLLPHQDA